MNCLFKSAGLLKNRASFQFFQRSIGLFSTKINFSQTNKTNFYKINNKHFCEKKTDSEKKSDKETKSDKPKEDKNESKKDENKNPNEDPDPNKSKIH